MSGSRWVLSGTPKYACFDDIRRVASLLGVHLGRKHIERMEALKEVSVTTGKVHLTLNHGGVKAGEERSLSEVRIKLLDLDLDLDLGPALSHGSLQPLFTIYYNTSSYP